LSLKFVLDNLTTSKVVSKRRIGLPTLMKEDKWSFSLGFHHFWRLMVLHENHWNMSSRKFYKLRALAMDSERGERRRIQVWSSVVLVCFLVKSSQSYWA